MNRRALLTRASAFAAAAVAGCLSGSAGVGSPDGGADTATSTPSEPGTTDGGPTDTVTDRPTPPHDAPFPPERDDVDDVVWYREVSDPESALVLEHSAGSVALPEAEISFTLTNGTDRTFATNFYDWALYRWEAGRWFRIAPFAVPEPLMSLEPGESHTWTLTLDDTEPGDGRVRSQGTERITVRPVGGGSYAFGVGGWWQNQSATPVYKHQTVCAARFRLDGPDLELVASDAVTDTRRDGDTVVVSAENPDDGGDPATYVLTRDEDAADPEQLITEQVYRQWPLRDALAHADAAVREVRVETTTSTVPPFGVQDDEPPIRYDGRTYRITAE